MAVLIPLANGDAIKANFCRAFRPTLLGDRSGGCGDVLGDLMVKDGRVRKAPSGLVYPSRGHSKERKPEKERFGSLDYVPYEEAGRSGLR